MTESKSITGRFEWDKNGALFFYPESQEDLPPAYWNGKSPDPHHHSTFVALISGLLWFKKLDQGKFQFIAVAEGELAIPFEKLNLNILASAHESPSI